jgi:hypothetical protein
MSLPASNDFATLMHLLHLAREPSSERTGVFTSGIVSTQHRQRIALYLTGCQHGANICATCWIIGRANSLTRADV